MQIKITSLTVDSLKLFRDVAFYKSKLDINSARSRL